MANHFEPRIKLAEDNARKTDLANNLMKNLANNLGPRLKLAEDNAQFSLHRLREYDEILKNIDNLKNGEQLIDPV